MNKELHVVFVDFEKAYDRVLRELTRFNKIRFNKIAIQESAIKMAADKEAVALSKFHIVRI